MSEQQIIDSINKSDDERILHLRSNKRDIDFNVINEKRVLIWFYQSLKILQIWKVYLNFMKKTLKKQTNGFTNSTISKFSIYRLFENIYVFNAIDTCAAEFDAQIPFFILRTMIMKLKCI